MFSKPFVSVASAVFFAAGPFTASALTIVRGSMAPLTTAPPIITGPQNQVALTPYAFTQLPQLSAINAAPIPTLAPSIQLAPTTKAHVKTAITTPQDIGSSNNTERAERDNWASGKIMFDNSRHFDESDLHYEPAEPRPLRYRNGGLTLRGRPLEPGTYVRAEEIRAVLEAFYKSYTAKTNYYSRYQIAYQNYVMVSKLRGSSKEINAAYKVADAIAEEYRQAVAEFENQVFSGLARADTGGPANYTDFGFDVDFYTIR